MTQKRMSCDGIEFHESYRPTDEVSTENEEGQLPLHLAAMNQSTIQESSGLKSKIESVYQSAPELVAALVTGRNPKNGKILFNVRRDSANRCLDCMHQDKLGMTPLHVAALHDSVAASKLVTLLLEANPLAARVFDMDGFLPLDHVCRSTGRGAASIVKLLLQAHPRGAFVQETASTDKDWRITNDKLNPCFDIKSREMSLIDRELSRLTDGILSDPALEEMNGSRYTKQEKDMSYLVPQRITVQRILLELSSFYRSGNIPEISSIVPLDRATLREWLASDKKNNKILSTDKIPRAFSRVIHAKEAGGLEKAFMRSKQTRDRRVQAKKIGFKSGWKDIADLFLPQSLAMSSSVHSDTFSPQVAERLPTTSRMSPFMSATMLSPKKAQTDASWIKHSESDIVLSGAVRKRGKLNTAFRTRFFVLDASGYLRYYKSAIDFNARMPPKGSAMVSCRGFRAEEVEGAEKDGFLFNVFAQEVADHQQQPEHHVFKQRIRRLECSCDTDAERKLWIMTLMRASSSRHNRPRRRIIENVAGGPLSPGRGRRDAAKERTATNRKNQNLSQEEATSSNLTPRPSLVSSSSVRIGSPRGVCRQMLKSAKSVQEGAHKISAPTSPGRLEIRIKPVRTETAQDLQASRQAIDAFMAETGLTDEIEIYPSTLQRAFDRKNIPTFDWMALQLIKEVDISNKGYITADEMREAIFRASRLSCMKHSISERWKDDSAYTLENNGSFTNLQTRHTVNRNNFAKVVENIKLDNIETRYLPTKMANHTWSGLPVHDEEDLQRAQPKVISARDLMDKMMLTPDDALLIRLPLHFCCANSLNPEAAVMMRDVLAAYRPAVFVRDRLGRLPLHVACMNESYTSATMVRLLIKAYPEAVQTVDGDGLLPLHLCLMHNHGDAALDIVTMLIAVFPRAARMPKFQTKSIDETLASNYAVHLALKNTSVFADKIISRLLEAYPEALILRDEAGATLLHHFCWIRHPCPVQVQRSLETDRGIVKWLRVPALHKEHQTRWDVDVLDVFNHKHAPGYDFPEQYSAVAKLEAILASASKYFPHTLNQVDRHGALPIHYLCQVEGPCSGELIKVLLRMHPHSFNIQDLNGNSPLHLAICSQKSDLARTLLQFASKKQWSSKLCVPNSANKMPSEVTHAWEVRALFKLNSKFDLANRCGQALFSPCLVALSGYLAADYLESDLPLQSSLMLAPFAVLTAAGIGLDLKETTFTEGFGNLFRLLYQTLLQIFQFRITLMSLTSVFRGYEHSLWLLLIKRLEMLIVCFPLGILSICCLFSQVPLEPKPSFTWGGAEGNSKQVKIAIHGATAVLCWSLLALSALEQDSHKLWGIPHMPMLRVGELCILFLFRTAESFVRLVNYALFASFVGVGHLLLSWLLEIFVMILLRSRLSDFDADPLSFRFLTMLAEEVFDLCGTFHPFRVLSEADTVLGQCGRSDAVAKTTSKLFIQFFILGLSCWSLDGAWVPGQQLHHFLHASNFVLVVMLGMMGQMIFLQLHLLVINVRKKHLVVVRELAQLESWSFPLFEGMTPDFFLDAQDVIITCSYQPGDRIVGSGENDATMHLLVAGLVSIHSSVHCSPNTSQGWEKWIKGNVFSRSSLLRRRGSESNSSVASKDLSGRCAEESQPSEVTFGLHGICFGAESILHGSRSPCAIIARTECSTRALTRESLRQLLAKHPGMKSKLLHNAHALGIQLSAKVIEDLINAGKVVPDGTAKMMYKSISRGRADIMVHEDSGQMLPEDRLASADVVLDDTWKELVSELVLKQDESGSLTLADVVGCIKIEMSSLLKIPGSSILISVDLHGCRHYRLTIDHSQANSEPDCTRESASSLVQMLQVLCCSRHHQNAFMPSQTFSAHSSIFSILCPCRYRYIALVRIHMYTHTCTHTRTHTHAYMHTCLPAYMRAKRHTQIHTHTHTHTHQYTRIHKYISQIHDTRADLPQYRKLCSGKILC